MKTFKSFLFEDRDKHLYHATYRIHKDSVNQHGLKANSDHKNWEDSKKGRVYLAKSPEVALSYAETSDEAPEKHYNSGIVVYKVNKKHLDQSKLHQDTNVQGDGDTVEYHGNIPAKHLKIHSEHDI